MVNRFVGAATPLANRIQQGSTQLGQGLANLFPRAGLGQQPSGITAFGQQSWAWQPFSRGMADVPTGFGLGSRMGGAM